MKAINNSNNQERLSPKKALCTVFAKAKRTVLPKPLKTGDRYSMPSTAQKLCSPADLIIFYKKARPNIRMLEIKFESDCILYEEF